MNRKRFFASLLALAMTLTLLSVGAAAAERPRPDLPDVFQGDGVYVTLTPWEIKSDGDYHPIINYAGFHEGFVRVFREVEIRDENGYYDGTKTVVNYADANGNLLPQDHDTHSQNNIRGGDFSDGMCVIYDGETRLFGYMDASGRTVIEPQFTEAGPFGDGLAHVAMYDDDDEEYHCYIDKTGKMAIGPFYRQGTLGDFHDGLARVSHYLPGSKDSFKGYIDTNGNPVITLSRNDEPVQDLSFCGYELSDFSDGYAILEKGDGSARYPTYVIIDTQGNQTGVIADSAPYTIKPEGVFHDGQVRVTRTNTDPGGGSDPSTGTGAMDHTGKVVAPYGAFMNAHSYTESGVSLEYSSSGYILVDARGQGVMPIFDGLFPDYEARKEYMRKTYGNHTLFLDMVVQNEFEDGKALLITSLTDGMNYYGNFYYLLETHKGAYTGPGRVFDSIKGQFVEGGTTPTDPVTPSGNTPSSWALENVKTAVAAGIVPETLQSAYTQATTRAEFCALAVDLYETVKGTEITERASFSDTTDVNVEKMAGLKVVNGVGGGKFDPAARLTRQEAATMLARLANAIGKPLTAGTPGFADSASIAGWAVDAVGQVQAAGIMNGIEGNRFAPSDPYTREQSIVTILRLYDMVK